MYRALICWSSANNRSNVVLSSLCEIKTKEHWNQSEWAPSRHQHNNNKILTFSQLHKYAPGQACKDPLLTRCPCLPVQPTKAAWWPWPLTFWHESGVRLTCDVGYLCANFGLPRPFCYRLRPDVRDRQTDGQTSDSIIIIISAHIWNKIYHLTLLAVPHYWCKRLPACIVLIS